MPNKYIYIVLEFIFGIGLAILSFYLYTLYDTESSLMDDIFYSFLFLYAGALLGIWSIGYFYFKKIQRLKNLVSAIFLSILGLIAFLTISMVIDFSGSIAFIVLPIAGAVFGFNSTNLIFQKTNRGI